ncbi:hypothetical protein BD413DRAFT_485671 [Trametes elegans]|nr:hypothetical protein BD413DRAFT_485671 [Trametes elegans]
MPKRKGLDRLVRDFEADKTLSFSDTSGGEIQFPFDAFKVHHHGNKPDISVSFPGRTVSTKTWQNIAMVIEVKASETQDPFEAKRKGATNNATVEQLAKSARSLLLAHGFLAAFAVGIYGNRVRLVRVDHTCALVSLPFKLRSKPGSKLLQKFFWHFVHPVVGNTVVGCDPTISPLTAEDREWVAVQLKEANVDNRYARELDKARRFEVYNEETGEYEVHIGFDVLDVNGRLFSRATTIWRTLKDTRIRDPSTGRLTPDPAADVKLCIIKEAWRQLARISEAKFYQRLAARIPQGQRRGLATMICGGDLGDLEFRWWKQTKSRPTDGDSESTLAGSETSGQLSSSVSSTRQPSRAASTSSFSTRASSTFVTTGSQTAEKDNLVFGPDHIPNSDFPLPYPQHQTYSWRIVDPARWHSERSHMRMVIKEVGRPLTQFMSSEELAEAVRDSLLGHRQAYVEAGVLHRDFSLGNILITDKPKGDDPIGYIHDLDYSSMTPDDETTAPTSAEAPADSKPTSDNPEDSARQKERTGTYYFMAVELLRESGVIHDVHHDLESYYWVLLWVVLRHTNCSRKGVSGQEICKRLFVYGDDTSSVASKHAWLVETARSDLIIQDNPALTTLLKRFAELVLKQVLADLPFVPGDELSNRLTYEAVLSIFNDALNPDNVWPEADWKHCDLLDSGSVPPSVVARLNVAGDLDDDESPARAGTKRSRRPGRGAADEEDAGVDPAARAEGSRKRSRTRGGGVGPPPAGQAAGAVARPSRQPPKTRKLPANRPATAPTRASARLAAKKAARGGAGATT